MALPYSTPNFAAARAAWTVDDFDRALRSHVEGRLAADLGHAPTSDDVEALDWFGKRAFDGYVREVERAATDELAGVPVLQRRRAAPVRSPGGRAGAAFGFEEPFSHVTLMVLEHDRPGLFGARSAGELPSARQLAHLALFLGAYEIPRPTVRRWILAGEMLASAVTRAVQLAEATIKATRKTRQTGPLDPVHRGTDGQLRYSVRQSRGPKKAL